MLRQKQSETESVAPTAYLPPSDTLEERFQEAIESGEIDGDTLLVDAQGREVKTKKPLVSIFDL